MTLSCRCGGAVEVIKNFLGEDSLWELYRCARCGDTGSQTLYSDPLIADERTGCIA